MYGFIVRAAAGQDADALRRSLAEQLAPAGLVVDDRALAPIVVTREGSQATETDRQLVIALLADEVNAGDATVSDLIDLSA
jgi:hypothetical protein